MYAITTCTSRNRQTYEEVDTMPPLKQNRPETIPTFLNLPKTTRDELESAIGHGDIKTLTDAVVEAAKLLAAKVKKTQGKRTK
jgi:mevalonate kinase